MNRHIKLALDLYVEKGYQPGGFLTAVLENNLSESFGRSDHKDRRDLFSIVSYVYRKLPYECRGSATEVNQWMQKHSEKRSQK